MPTNSYTKAPVLELLLAKASEHGTLVPADISAIRRLQFAVRAVSEGEDIVRQGDRPDTSVMVLNGMLARYHTLPTGDRQYLSMHIRGDMPDLQSLFLSAMDHSLCALDAACVALFPHAELVDLILKRPGVAFAFWRLTLVDAAIFRAAITNNSARSPLVRVAHFFCEQIYRAREAQVVEDYSCSLPLTQDELGHTLGMSLVSVNRTIQRLRKDNLIEHRAYRLLALDWQRLTDVAGFDPAYLHVAKESRISQSAFPRRF